MTNCLPVLAAAGDTDACCCPALTIHRLNMKFISVESGIRKSIMKGEFLKREVFS